MFQLLIFIHFTSVVVTEVSSQSSAPSSTLWNDCNLSSDFVKGHGLTMWLVVCHCLHSQMADLAKPPL